MKTRTNYYLLGLFMALIMSACHQEKKEVTSSLSKEDSLKIAVYDQFFGNNAFKSIESINDIRVSDTVANESIQAYKDLGRGINLIKMKKLLETQAVSFSFDSLRKWINSLPGSSDADNIRICFGVNTEKYCRKFNKPDSLKGKMTVFLWPYKGKHPARNINTRIESDEFSDPFNLGTLYP